MSIEEIEEITTIFSALARYGFEGLVAGLVVFFLIKHFLPGYLSQKGKNLATKEDIEEITDKIEQIKNQYQQIIENKKAKHQLRLAAIDRRLEAHQEAYGLWRKINGSLGKDNIQDVALECSEWWSKNSLYLESEARKAFLLAWVGARDLAWYKEQVDKALVTKTYKEIEAAGEAITKAIELPVINELLLEKEPNKKIERGG